MKKILIITERRADFSRFKPIIDLIKNEKQLSYQLLVTGLHLVKEHGYTIKDIKKEKISIYKKFKMFDKKYFKNNDGAEMVNALGTVLKQLSKIVKKAKPDLILSGFDIAANFALTITGAHMNIPVAHIQGGEVSGTIDESLRHAMSKFANFHFTANEETKKRLIKLGEEKRNIYSVGCPSIDALILEKNISKKEIYKKFKIDLNKWFLLVIQHPVTSEVEIIHKQMIKTIKAVSHLGYQHLIIFPNNDAGSGKILKEIKKSKLNYAKTLSLREYKTLLSHKMVLIGNSSSAIHEAASFSVPAINIGSRQEGRLKPANVLTVDHNYIQIKKAIKKCLSNSFNNKIKKLKNPYGDGKSSKRIINIIKKIDLKTFNTQKKLTY